MNSVALATTTHRKIGRMPDGIGTQVKVQMINKCKALISNKDESHKPVRRKKAKDAKGEATAATLNAWQLLFWPH